MTETSRIFLSVARRELVFARRDPSLLVGGVALPALAILGILLTEGLEFATPRLRMMIAVFPAAVSVVFATATVRTTERGAEWILGQLPVPFSRIVLARTIFWVAVAWVGLSLVLVQMPLGMVGIAETVLVYSSLGLGAFAQALLFAGAIARAAGPEGRVPGPAKIISLLFLASLCSLPLLAAPLHLHAQLLMLVLAAFFWLDLATTSIGLLDPVPAVLSQTLRALAAAITFALAIGVASAVTNLEVRTDLAVGVSVVAALGSRWISGTRVPAESQRPRAGAVVPWVMAILGGFVTAGMAAVASSRFAIGNAWLKSAATDWPAAGLVFLMALSALSEEYVFRWLVQRRLQVGERVLTPVVLSAAAFAVVHNTATVPFALLLGLLSAILFQRYRRLGPCIVLHLIYDVLIAYLPHLNRNYVLG